MLTKTQIQKEALKKLQAEDYRGTVCLEMGTGKTKLGLDVIRDLQDSNDHLEVLIIVPTKTLIKSWQDEIRKWWGEADLESLLSITILTMQSAWKLDPQSYDVIIIDEIHMVATPVYGQVLDNLTATKALVGLTGTPDLENEDKAEYYEKYCPIIYSYYDSAEDGLINKTKYYVHLYTLTDAYKVAIKLKTGAYYVVGEKTRYGLLERNFKEAGDTMYDLGSSKHFVMANIWKNSRDLIRKNAAWRYIRSMMARKDFLLKLESSKAVAQQLTEKLLKTNDSNKVIIFSELIEKAEELSDNPVHSKQDKEQNQQAIERFNKGDSRVLSTAYALNLGINLVGATHAIMESLVGSRVVFQQRRGRTSRLETSDISEVHIIIPKNTQTMVWFSKASASIPKDLITYVDYEL